jgi:hypothetical protein
VGGNAHQRTLNQQAKKIKQENKEKPAHRVWLEAQKRVDKGLSGLKGL